MPKKNPADVEVERCFEIQKNAAKKSRVADIALLVMLAAVIAVFGIMIYVLPHSSFSEDENRGLTLFPEFSLKSIVDGSYTSDIGKFYSDQFPARRFFVELKAAAELAQLKMQNNSVIPGKNGTLIKRQEYTDYSYAHKNMKAIEKFRGVLEQDGIPVFTVIAPRSIDVLAHTIHPLYGSDRSDGIWQVFSEYDEEATALRDMLKAQAEDGNYVWYRTDHHWTTQGAYLVYAALGERLGYTPYPESFFSVEQVSDSFYGTTYSSSGLYSTAPDEMYYYRYDGDQSYVVENVLTGDKIDGFYDTALLETKDKYSSFIGGNNAHVRVYDTAAKGTKPTLILVKDSFAHSVVPFLALHFDLEIIDLRSYVGSVAALARETKACGVVILNGADNLAISDTLTLLGYGLNKKAE